MSLDKKSLQIQAKSCDFILNPGNIRKSENKVVIYYNANTGRRMCSQGSKAVRQGYICQG